MATVCMHSLVSTSGPKVKAKVLHHSWVHVNTFSSLRLQNISLKMFTMFTTVASPSPLKGRESSFPSLQPNWDYSFRTRLMFFGGKQNRFFSLCHQATAAICRNLSLMPGKCHCGKAQAVFLISAGQKPARRDLTCREKIHIFQVLTTVAAPSDTRIKQITDTSPCESAPGQVIDFQ